MYEVQCVTWHNGSPGKKGGGRGREAVEQGTASGSKNKEGDRLLFITGYYSVENTYLAKFWNFHHQCLKENLEARKRKFALGLEKQHYIQWIWKSLQFDYVIGQDL